MDRVLLQQEFGSIERVAGSFARSLRMNYSSLECAFLPVRRGVVSLDRTRPLLPNAPATGLVAGIGSKLWRDEANFCAVDRLAFFFEPCLLIPSSFSVDSLMSRLTHPFRFSLKDQPSTALAALDVCCSQTPRAGCSGGNPAHSRQDSLGFASTFVYAIPARDPSPVARARRFCNGRSSHCSSYS